MTNQKPDFSSKEDYVAHCMVSFKALPKFTEETCDGHPERKATNMCRYYEHGFHEDSFLCEECLEEVKKAAEAFFDDPEKDAGLWICCSCKVEGSQYQKTSEGLFKRFVEVKDPEDCSVSEYCLPCADKVRKEYQAAFADEFDDYAIDEFDDDSYED